MTYSDLAEIWRSGVNEIECHSSGSTGAPKSIFIPREQLIKSALRTIDYFNLTKSSTLYSCISPDYIGGKMMLIRAEVCGGKLCWEKPSNRPLFEGVTTEIDLLAVVPSQMRHIIDNINQIPKIRNIIIGGAPIPVALKEEIVKSGLNAYETYGMTETASHIALRKIEESNQGFSPLADIEIGLDQRDCLVITIPDWGNFITNDIAQINSDNTFNILGRYDNIIITGGKKVNPEEIEQELEVILDCEVIAWGAPNALWGEIINIAVAPDCVYTEEEIIRIAKELLPPEKRPRRAIKTDIPHLSNGKKDRKALQISVFV